MKIKILNLIILSVLLTATGPAFAITTPENQDQLRIKFSTPTKKGETLLSYTVTWRIDDGLTNRASGLTFIQGPDTRKHTSDVQAAKKMVIALNDAMEYLYPSWRGAKVEQPKDQPEIIISNKQGFDFTEVTVRDYSNQTISFDVLGDSFTSKQIGIALDVVYAADVENLAEFTPNKPKISSGGTVEVTLDDKETIIVKTDGKTTSQIEQDLAKALGGIASYSTSPIFPNLKDSTTRNYKPFDGGEVQVIGLPVKSISVNVTDSSLGILSKFAFPDTNKPTDVANRLPYLIFIGAGAVFAYFFFNWYIQNRKEQDSEEDNA